MACYRPITAWKPFEGGSLLFSEKRDCREIKIACGQCIGCRIAKQEMWAIRCYAESKMHERNCFVTLTYEDMPQNGSLNYRHFQLFMKRLRKKCGPVRFFMCGEYGEQLERPHYHCLFFGFDFPDKVKCNSLRSSHDIFRSPTLEGLWSYGFSSIGEVNFATARYCATYAVKKVTGERAEDFYSRVNTETGEIVKLEREFAHMSLRPGIGFSYLEKYWRDLYSIHDAVIIDGKRKRIPRYFDQKMDDLVPLLMDDIEFKRFKDGERTAHDRTRERLEVREVVALAQQKFNKERSFNNAV